MNYWCDEGRYQKEYNELTRLIPLEGEVKKGMCKHVSSLERLRKATNCYYDVFNNGGGNRDHATSKFFPGVLQSIRHSYKWGGSVDWDYVHSVCDKKMDVIIREAYIKNIGKLDE